MRDYQRNLYDEEEAIQEDMDREIIMEITTKEKEMIINIAENEYAPLNGDVPETYEAASPVWSDCLDRGPCKIPSESISGRMSSLIKKGLAGSDGEIKDACTWLTKEGFKIYQSFNRK